MDAFIINILIKNGFSDAFARLIVSYIEDAKFLPYKEYIKQGRSSIFMYYKSVITNLTIKGSLRQYIKECIADLENEISEKESWKKRKPESNSFKKFVDAVLDVNNGDDQAVHEFLDGFDDERHF